MSLMAPRTAEEAKFQYCNYGYDKTKYSSYEDCLKKNGIEFWSPGRNDLTELETATKKNMEALSSKWMLLSGVGFIGGLFFAHSRKSGGWGYLGWAILGSMVGSTIGYTIARVGK